MAGSRVLLWVAIVLVAAWFLYTVRTVLLPFVVGIVVAALLEPAIRRLRRRGFSRKISVAVVSTLFFVVAAAIIAIATPTVANQVRSVQPTIETYFENLLSPMKEEVFLSKVEKTLPKDLRSASRFRAWIRGEVTSSLTYEEFFDQYRYELRRYGLPTNREDLSEAFYQPASPGPVDQWLAERKASLSRFGIPSRRGEIEEQFGLKQRIEEWVSTALGGAGAIFSYLMSSLFLLLFTPIITILILLDYDNFRRRALTWIPPTIRPTATDVLGDIGEVLSGYVRGITLSITIYGAVMAALLTILGVPFSLFLGLLFAVFYLIPYIGFIFSTALLLLAIATKGTPDALIFSMGTMTTYVWVVVLAYIVVDRFYDVFVHPRIIGRSVGLHMVTSFFVIFAGGTLFGLAGMILAFPIAGTVKVVLDRLIRYTSSYEGTLDLPRTPSRHASGPA